MRIKEVVKKIIGLNKFRNVTAPNADRFSGCHVDFPDLINIDAKIESCSLYGKVHIAKGAKMYSVLAYGVEKGDISIGCYSILNANTEIHAYLNKVKIGNFCSIGKGVLIQEYFHDKDRLTTFFILHHVFNEEWGKEIVSKGGITIGHDVWIGSQSIILSGVTIGNGAIIGANSLVNTDVPPFAIAAGSPARIIKYRFNEEIIKKLNDINWWEWPIKKIKDNRHLFDSKFDIKALELIK